MLHYAARGDKADNAALLVSWGADVNLADKVRVPVLDTGSRVPIPIRSTYAPVRQAGETPLHFAAFDGHIASLKMLVQHGASVHAVSEVMPRLYALLFMST